MLPYNSVELRIWASFPGCPRFANDYITKLCRHPHNCKCWFQDLYSCSFAFIIIPKWPRIFICQPYHTCTWAHLHMFMAWYVHVSTSLCVQLLIFTYNHTNTWLREHMITCFHRHKCNWAYEYTWIWARRHMNISTYAPMSIWIHLHMHTWWVIYVFIGWYVHMLMGGGQPLCDSENFFQSISNAVEGTATMWFGKLFPIGFNRRGQPLCDFFQSVLCDFFQSDPN